jgi:hypothetical protein
MTLVDETNSDLEKLCKAYSVQTVGEMALNQYQDAIKKLSAKKGR